MKKLIIFALTAAMITAGVGGNKAFAQQPTVQKIIGASKTGTINAFGDRVILIAAEWRGPFTKENAHHTFNGAVQHQRGRGLTCADADAARQTTGDDVQKRTLGSDRHAVIGWQNLNTGGFVWIAIQRGPQPTTIRFAKCDSSTTSIANDWKVVDTETNGKRIRIQFADDDAGGMIWMLKLLN